MIALLLALQIAATSANPIPAFIFVRDGSTVTPVPVTIEGG